VSVTLAGNATLSAGGRAGDWRVVAAAGGEGVSAALIAPIAANPDHIKRKRFHQQPLMSFIVSTPVKPSAGRIKAQYISVL